MTRVPEATSFVPAPSSLPLLASFFLFLIAFGLVGCLARLGFGEVLVFFGILGFLAVVASWFGAIIRESRLGLYDSQIQELFRLSMFWFLCTEVLFFLTLFSVFFYIRNFTLPLLSDIDHQSFLWPNFKSFWPTFGPAEGIIAPFKEATLLFPTLNSLLLLSSSGTLSFSSWHLKKNNPGSSVFYLGLTVFLGVVFLFFQSYEYLELYQDFNLKLDSGIYGSLFYFLTGFHGFHVLVGVLLLSVVFWRLCLGHFRADSQFAFEAAALYWHFVDVVWFILYFFVYFF